MGSKQFRKSTMWLALSLVLMLPASTPDCQAPPPTRVSTSPVLRDTAEDLKAREVMVQRQIVARDVRDLRVLQAMSRVPRHLFVPPAMQSYAYIDSPLAIGHGQTISQPYIVAFMTEALRLQPNDRVLEVGTGSGYQAAVLSVLVREVYSVEIVEPLATEATARLRRLGYANVTIRAGDGYRGWPEKAPFNAIMVTAAPDHVPQALLDQLAPGGRLILPVGNQSQALIRIRRTANGFNRENLLPVRFVPMTGEAANPQAH